MKKKTLIVLIIAVLVIAAAAVIAAVLKNQSDDSKDDSTGFSADAVITETGNFSDVEGLTVSLKSYDLQSENPYIEILWKNDSEFNATYGLGYDIQKEVDGEWKSCATGDVIVQSIACLLDSGEENTQKYYLSEFDIDKGTKYRFTAECYISAEDEAEMPDNCKLYTEFTVG